LQQTHAMYLLPSAIAPFIAAFKYFPIQGTVEGLIVSSQLKLFGKSMSAACCMIDTWGGWDMEAVRAYEAVSPSLPPLL
jgi:hypothetical protein